MSDRICLMRAGRIAQIGTPRELYDRPANRYVADFVGRANILAGKVAQAAAGGRARVVLGGDVTVEVAAPVPVAAGQEVEVAIRPESLRLAAGPDAGASGLQARMTHQTFLGEHIECLLAHPVLGQLQVNLPRQAERSLPGVGVGSTVHVLWDHGAGLILGQD